MAQFRHLADVVTGRIEFGGLWLIEYAGLGVMPLLASCQPPLLAARSPSTSNSMKARSPQRLAGDQVFDQIKARSCGKRLCIQPVWLSWRMAASMIGMPV